MNTLSNSLKRLWPKGIFSADERRRRSYILNIILIGSIILLAWADICILKHSLNPHIKHRGISFGNFSLILLLFIFIYVLFKRGHITLSSYMLILSYYLGATYGSYHWGVSVPSILLSYALIITMASILLGSTFGFSITTIIFITLLICGFKELTSAAIPSWKYEALEMGDIIFYSIILMIIMLISWLWNRETEKSLARALESEKSLQNERDMLEIKIEQRTEELKRLQFERVSELYHFAKFGKLSGGLFHDLVNPLSSIALNIENIDSSFHNELPDIKENIERSLKASRKMERFINAAKRQLRVQDFYENFSLNEIIKDALLLVNYKAMKNEVKLHFKASKDIKTFNNPIKFQQIVTNLISNAIDAYEGCDIKPEDKIVNIELFSDEINNATLIVSDNGHGIKQEIKDKIFNPFFTTKTHYKGMGLGLSTTKHIVEKDFEGIISIKEQLENGACFIVTFPLILDSK